MTPTNLTERKWRVGPPTAGVPGSLYDFIRRHLCDRGGSATRNELHAAIQADQRAAERLSRSQGFNSVLNNMKHSGDVIFEGDTVRATSRTIRRLKC